MIHLSPLYPEMPLDMMESDLKNFYAPGALCRPCRQHMVDAGKCWHPSVDLRDNPACYLLQRGQRWKETVKEESLYNNLAREITKLVPGWQYNGSTHGSTID